MTDLDMDGASSKFTPRLIVELDPSRVIVKAGAFPAQVRAITGRFKGGTDEGGEEVDSAPEAVEDGPRYLSGKQGENVHGVEREFRGPAVWNMGGENEKESEDEQERRRIRSRSHEGVLKTAVQRARSDSSNGFGERGEGWRGEGGNGRSGSQGSAIDEPWTHPYEW